MIWAFSVCMVVRLEFCARSLCPLSPKFHEVVFQSVPKVQLPVVQPSDRKGVLSFLPRSDRSTKVGESHAILAGTTRRVCLGNLRGQFETRDRAVQI